MDGVFSFWELSQPLVARLAEHLGLPGNPPAAVDNARDKQVRTADLPQKHAALLHTKGWHPDEMPSDLPPGLQQQSHIEA